MRIVQAERKHCSDIASLIIQAMTEECCLSFVGEGNTIDDFRSLMSDLTAMDESQYSYRNTLVAITDDESVAGACVSYQGDDLHRLREPFVREAKARFGVDHSGIDDETEAGELYIDSIAVYPEYRRRGIAKALLNATMDKAHGLGLSAGLLVDKANPNAERLYTALGFKHVDDKTWGGHGMKHLVKE
mgnify:CR=1 FL=1